MLNVSSHSSDPKRKECSKILFGQKPCSTPLQRFKLKVQNFFRSDYVVVSFRASNRALSELFSGA